MSKALLFLNAKECANDIASEYGRWFALTFNPFNLKTD
jgi:hypothetical protein